MSIHPPVLPDLWPFPLWDLINKAAVSNCGKVFVQSRLILPLLKTYLREVCCHCIVFFSLCHLSQVKFYFYMCVIMHLQLIEFTGPSGFPGGSVVKGRLSEYMAYTYWTLRCVGAGTVPIFFS